MPGRCPRRETKTKTKAAALAVRRRGAAGAGSLYVAATWRLMTRGDSAPRLVASGKAIKVSTGRVGVSACEPRSAAGMALTVKVGVLLLLALVGLGNADEAPRVEVYSRRHVANGEENVLHCFVSGFHPPQISITLLKNGEPMSDVKYADMSFNNKWHFQQLVYAPFTPQRGDIYSCRVVHSALPEPQTYRWDPDF